MVQSKRQLSRRDIAGLVGIEIGTVDAHRRRGTLPPPDGFLGRSPWWWERTIEKWAKTRRSPGQHADAAG